MPDSDPKADATSAAYRRPQSRDKISVVVVSYNREAILDACLAPLSFADELIVIDKSSTDHSADIAARYGQRIIIVPWSPVVEDTRAFALAQCTHDWILVLDDDECLSVEAVAFIEQELVAPRADIYGIAQRHYILGIHDERAYYWPEFQPRMFRRGAVSFVPTVHGGYVFHSDRRYDVPPETGVCVHHLSHRNVGEWIAKANRYTSAMDRTRITHAGNDLVGFAHDRIDFWRAATRAAAPDSYPMAAALLRATYDIIDRLKIWEEEEGLDGDKVFRDFAAAHQARFAPPAPHDVQRSTEVPPPAAHAPPDMVAVLRDSLRHVRAMAELVNHTNAQAMLQARELSNERIAAADGKLEAERAALRGLRSQAAMLEERAHDLRLALEATHASSSWRITAPLRHLATRYPNLVPRVANALAHMRLARQYAGWIRQNARRAATGQTLLPRPVMPEPGVATHSAPRVRPPGANPVSWFYVGDTMEWLATHSHLTGVGRVTTEILAAALGGTPWRICLMQGDDLVPWQPRRDRGQARASPAAADLHRLLSSAPVSKLGPQPGDHVLFTGVVWTPTYTALFRRLRERGVRFSVLLHDIIPLERPDLSDAGHVERFAQWVACVLQEAEVIFTATETVRRQIYRWAIAEGLAPRNPVCVVPFGLSFPRVADTAAAPLVQEPFVLCVGTIDRRKNQAFLCDAWARLAAERELPTLVLVGRDDIGLARLDADVAALVDQGRIRIVSDLDDQALDALYRAALFTVFPSLSEGYGLPVVDSIARGKLCVASDLPVLREIMGDLPWYFDPDDAASLTAQIARALDDVPARAAQEARLQDWQPQRWQHTVRAIEGVILPRLSLPDPDAPPRIDFPVKLTTAPAAIIAQAQRWCVERQPEVSIIVVNWNATAMTRACIRQIWANTSDVSYEIVVADNGSEPRGLDILRGPGGGLRLLSLGTNRFFGEANNIAVEAARGRFVCLLNNDVFVDPGWLKTLLAALQNAPEAGAVGPVFLFADGTIQEAGGMVNEQGFPERLLRGASAAARADIEDRVVDYISAACLLLPRDLFLRAGGFDLAYEPAYYEDTDLCFKLAALGHGVKLVAAVDVVHLEGHSTGDDAIPSARKKALGDLNRGKFVARWGGFLRDRDAGSLQASGAPLLPSRAPADTEPPARCAMLYSPFLLTPGGGERYLLTIAAALARDHAVTIVTPHPYSRLRLQQLGIGFGIDLSGCATAVLEETGQDWDVMVTMGNHVLPPIPARGRLSLFHCQFPFPLPVRSPIDPALLAGYDAILANSQYTKRNIEAGMADAGLPSLPVHVLYPPVPQAPARTAPKKAIILTVGRFFTGGHRKRHDVLIKAFRTLKASFAGEVEFHLVGSSTPDAAHMDYLARLQDMAANLPVVFHVNAQAAELEALYQQAAIYWHGTGLGSDVQRSPELAEHFGITIVEAMSAGCVTFALAAGGAMEIITDGVDGCLYDTQETLVERTLALLGDPAQCRMIGTRARQRAADFTVLQFTDAVQGLVA